MANFQNVVCCDGSDILCTVWIIYIVCWYFYIYNMYFNQIDILLWLFNTGDFKPLVHIYANQEKRLALYAQSKYFSCMISLLLSKTTVLSIIIYISILTTIDIYCIKLIWNSSYKHFTWPQIIIWYTGMFYVHENMITFLNDSFRWLDHLIKVCEMGS